MRLSGLSRRPSPLRPCCRDGAHPDELVVDMRESGADLGDADDRGVDEHNEAAFASAHRITGVHPAPEHFASAEFVCGLAPVPRTWLRSTGAGRRPVGFCPVRPAPGSSASAGPVRSRHRQQGCVCHELTATIGIPDHCSVPWSLARNFRRRRRFEPPGIGIGLGGPPLIREKTLRSASSGR
ncbi:DUF6461 domain-containing protein [Actinacidiphila glaucinigra]|uniref:DUF6461 domain-containing protein n=1 Tax=Actinacidiphila glaucinigra TaxID=235986 RepID=UPI0033B56582